MIQKQAKLLGKTYPGLVKDYEKIWEDPRDSFCNSTQWLEQQLKADCKIHLEEFQYSEEYDETELSRLILESEFRLCVCDKARLRLVKLCETAYDLDHGLFAEFD